MSIAGIALSMLGTSAFAQEYSVQSHASFSTTDSEPSAAASSNLDSSLSEMELMDFFDTLRAILAHIDSLEGRLDSLKDIFNGGDDDENEEEESDDEEENDEDEDEDEEEDDNDEDEENEEEDDESDDEEEEDEEEDDNDDDEQEEENYAASLTGDQEVPPVTSTGSGVGSFHLIGNDLHYEIAVQNLSSAMTAAHFHMAPRGEAGPVIETITMSGTTAVGTWMDLTADEIEQLDDELIYVNVHTTNHPSGEVRGQLED